MKRPIMLLLVMGILFVDRVEGQGRGNFGAGRSQHGGHHGHAGFGGGRGHSGSDFRPRAMGGFNFGSSHRGAYYRHRLYSPGFLAPFYWSSDYTAPIIEAELLLPGFQKGPQLYYQKAPAPDVEPNCKDTWSKNLTPNSVSQIMNRMFDLQCENRHPSPDTELRHPGTAASGGQDSATPPVGAKHSPVK